MREEFTTSALWHDGRLYVTREITGLEAPFTKWDLLSDTEREAYSNSLFELGESSCRRCGEKLHTEADFAKHYIISDVRYFNLGDCPKHRMGSYQGEVTSD